MNIGKYEQGAPLLRIMPKKQAIYGADGIDFEKCREFLVLNPEEFEVEDPDATAVVTFRPKKWSRDVAVQISYRGILMLTLPETYSQSMVRGVENHVKSVLSLASGCDVKLAEHRSRRHMVVNIDVKLGTPPPLIGSEDRARAALRHFQIVEVTLFTSTETMLRCDDNSGIYGISLQSFEKPVYVSLLSEQNGTVSGTINATSLGANEYYRRGSWEAPIGAIGPGQVLRGHAENLTGSETPAVGSVAAAVIFKRLEP